MHLEQVYGWAVFRVSSKYLDFMGFADFFLQRLPVQAQGGTSREAHLALPLAVPGCDFVIIRQEKILDVTSCNGWRLLSGITGYTILAFAVCFKNSKVFCVNYLNVTSISKFNIHLYEILNTEAPSNIPQ